MVRHLLIFVVCLTLLVSARAQVVKGKVVDAATGNPIARASVYLKGSSKGTASNARGEFELYTDETKKPLVISYVGYQPDTIYNYNNKTLTVKLSPRTQVLREVVVGEVIMTREKQMKMFLTEFIGSRNKDCVITNPDDINFTYHKKTKVLEASADQPLIIYNKTLGYKITYFLSVFSHSPTEMKTSYKGNYVFAEDTLNLTPGDIKKILKARDKAYFGSRMHFMRSVWNNDLEKNKFYYGWNNTNFNNTNYVFHNINANREQLLNYTFIDNDIHAVRWSGLNMALKVALPLAYFNYDNKYGNGDWSYITFKSGTKDVAINANSYNDSELVWSGKAAEQRVSELLPVDFEPSEPLSNTPNGTINAK